MLNHIKADLYRITKKKSLYIMMALFTIGFSFVSFNFRTTPDVFPEFIGFITQMSPILIGIFIFTIIYTDDLKSHTVQTAIGFGIKRTEIVITKVIEATILLLFFYLYVLVHIFAVNLIFSFNMNSDGFTMIFRYALTYFIQTIAFFAISSVIIFSMQKATLSTVFFVLLGSGFVDQILGLVFSFNLIDKLLGFIKPYFIGNITNDFLMALNGIGDLLVPGLTFAVYIIGSIVIASFLFNKVELEF